MASQIEFQPLRQPWGVLRDTCSRGHPYTPENTRIRDDMPVPVRVCRKCDVIRTLDYRKRKREDRG
jgi:hypothetical protein